MIKTTGTEKYSGHNKYDEILNINRKDRAMKLAVIYDSKSGNTRLAAEWIEEGMRNIHGIETGVFSIHTIEDSFVKESKGIVIGSPSYSASITPDMRTWLFESAGRLEMGGKLGGAFATVQYTHGGGDLVIQSILNIELSYGMLCYSSGTACGKPYIHLGPVGVNHNVEAHNAMDHYREYFVVYGKRFAEKALEIFA